MEIKRNTCIINKHPNRECFNSMENKGKSCFVCKDCRMYLGIIYPLDNEDKYEEDL